MNRFRGFLICTDCDGTLTYEAGKVSDENAQAIRYFQEEGGLFTLATGRFPGHAYEFQEKVRVNAPVVALNGTVLYDLAKKRIIHEWTTEKQDCYELLSYIQKNYPEVWELWVNYTFQDSVSFQPGNHPYQDGALEQFFDRLPDRLYKFLSFQKSELTPVLQQDLKARFHDRFRFDMSWPEGLEIQPINSGKGIAVQYMKEQLGFDIHTTVGVGDYENDLNLLQYADIGYAVENAVDSVKAAADRITVSNKEHALAKIIADLEREIGETKR